MNLLLEFETRHPIPPPQGFQHAVVRIANDGNRLIARGEAGQLAGRGLDRPERSQHVLDFAGIRIRDERTAIGNEIDQPVTSQQLHTVTQWRARHDRRDRHWNRGRFVGKSAESATWIGTGYRRERLDRYSRCGASTSIFGICLWRKLWAKLAANGTDDHYRNYRKALKTLPGTTPHQWPRQPWFAEIGDVHGNGQLIIFTDGSISDVNTVAKKQSGK